MALVSKLRQIGKRQWVIILGAFLGCVFIFLIVAGYWLHWTGLGFSNKTLWDWMQLLIIPTTLALVAILFNRAERKNEQVIASDNQREATLEAYLSRLSELFLERDLTTS